MMRGDDREKNSEGMVGRWRTKLSLDKTTNEEEEEERSLPEGAGERKT